MLEFVECLHLKVKRQTIKQWYLPEAKHMSCRTTTKYKHMRTTYVVPGVLINTHLVCVKLATIARGY